MKVNLTLNVDKEVVRRIKRLARDEGTSVSAMFDRWARFITRRRWPTRVPGPTTQRALGTIKYSGKKTDRQLVEEALLEKYGL